MWDSRRGWIVPSLSVLFLLWSLGLVACKTRPLVLEPRIRPLDYAPELKFESLHIMSFVDETPEEETGFLELEKRYRYAPVDVLNDTLLVSLRQSQAFERVQRNPRMPEGGYVLRGELVTLKTEESAFKFGLAPSTMKVTATCVTRYRLEDTATGEVLLKETIVSTGDGSVTVHGGSSGIVTTISESGELSTGTIDSPATYESTQGYEASISDAIGENVSLVTERIVTELAEQATARRTPPAGPSDRDTREPPAVGSPPPLGDDGSALELQAE
jgi:hypothetical protein